MSTVRVALLGCGNVGAQVARLLTAHAEDLAARVGAPLELVGVAVRRLDLDRSATGLDSRLFTTDPLRLATRADVDIVVELIGGVEPARTLVLAAMEQGAAVVTANKTLLAEDGATLHAAAEKFGVDLYYEAAVGGAIPLLRPLRESLAGDRIRRVLGIVNGTTNYVLDRMDTSGAEFADALAEAQLRGLAEADPTADLEGFDAAAKAAILASIAFHTPVVTADVHREGIGQVTAADVTGARDIGAVVKLLAICELADDERSVGVRVHPAMVPREHPLASVHGPYNAVFVESDAAGQLMFYGPGAGGTPSASAVLGDLVTVGRNRLSGTLGPGASRYADLRIQPIAETRTRYRICLDVDDRPGVLASVATVFAEHGVSIETVRQRVHGPDDAELVVVTHEATDDALAATVDGLRVLPSVRDVVSVMRVEGE
ncbi:MAG: homoserine dehydrogenase [Jiangellaceae bacterium]|nr:homoserine dehydrogenase [Jiangellaceae bacterium]